LRPFLSLLVAGSLAAGVIGLSSPVSAQTGNLNNFCAARLDIDGAEGRKENLTALNQLVAAAPAVVSQPMAALRDLYQKKSDDAFESRKGFALVTQLDTYIYENCPGQKVATTAIDYEYQGMPSTLAAGRTYLKLTNNAPKENHEMGIVKLLPAAEGKDVEELLAMPEKKLGKYVDFKNATGMFAPPGASGFAVTNLTPGTYLYACFLPVGGKESGKPHFTQGMYGTFTVA
jgi:uncharacterized cupredoxin-like copper-binding protein